MCNIPWGFLCQYHTKRAWSLANTIGVFTVTLEILGVKPVDQLKHNTHHHFLRS